MPTSRYPINYLVRGEAVVQLDYANQVSTFTLFETCLCKGLVGGIFGHRVAHELHCTLAFECSWEISRESLGDDFYGLVFKLVRMYKRLGGHNAASG